LLRWTLQAIGSALHPPAYRPTSVEDIASAACIAASQGWYLTLEEILCAAYIQPANMAEVISAAMSRERNLLLASIVSGCTDTVHTVLELLMVENLLSLATQPDAAGHTAMHVATAIADPDIICLVSGIPALLEDRDRQPANPAGPRSSAERSSQHHLRVAHLVMAALSFRTKAAMGITPVVWALSMNSLGWRNPLAWLSLLMASVTFHVLMPHAFYHLYLPRLEQLREAAADRGLLVTNCLQLVDRAADKRYQRFALRRTAIGWVGDTSLLLMLSAFLCSKLLQTHGMACALPQLCGILALTALRGAAVAAGWRRLRQWLDMVLEICILLVDHFPEILSWLTGAPNHCPLLPVDCRLNGSSLWVNAFSTLAAVACKFGVGKVLLIDKPLFWGAVVSELVIAAVLVTLVAPSSSFCLSYAAGGPQPTLLLCCWMLAAQLLCAVAYLSMAVKSECARLQEFLSAGIKEASD